MNVGCVFIAATVCAYGAQTAMGSGIPEIKCFLNGIRYDPWLSLRTYCVKVFGALFSVGSSMPVGKEGPMIHCGGAIGAAVAPRFKTLGADGQWRYVFRNDRAMRDFVSCGGAAGVAAAFGAPIGGVLFTLEEGCSFWNQDLTWRVLFTTMCTILMLNFLMAGILTPHTNGTDPWEQLEKDALINFGTFELNRIKSWALIDLLVSSLLSLCCC
jgi:H+/Cl- antiporter ClcA